MHNIRSNATGGVGTIQLFGPVHCPSILLTQGSFTWVSDLPFCIRRYCCHHTRIR